MADLRELGDLEEIKQLKARYCLLLDAQEWEALRQLFTDDAQFAVGSGGYSSPDAFIANLRSNLAGESHVHVAHMPIIEFTGPDTARGLWSFSNRGALGHYQDEYVRGHDGWRISAMTMTWIHPPSAQLLRERKGQFAAVADRWSTLAAAWGRSGPTRRDAG
jgi:SnoaL-like domain